MIPKQTPVCNFRPVAPRRPPLHTASPARSVAGTALFASLSSSHGIPLPGNRTRQKWAKRTKRVGASSRVRGRELSYGVHSIRLHHPTSGLNSPPFSVARVFCISLQYFHLSALPLTVPLQKAALVSAYSVTGKPLLFVSLFHRRCKQRKALCIRGLKHFLPTLFVL